MIFQDSSCQVWPEKPHFYTKFSSGKWLWLCWCPVYCQILQHVLLCGIVGWHLKKNSPLLPILSCRLLLEIKFKNKLKEQTTLRFQRNEKTSAFCAIFSNSLTKIKRPHSYSIFYIDCFSLCLVILPVSFWITKQDIKRNDSRSLTTHYSVNIDCLVQLPSGEGG